MDIGRHGRGLAPLPHRHRGTRPGLDFVGAVGTGWSGAAGRELLEQLRPAGRDTSRFSGPVPVEYIRAARWVNPQLVVDVEFRAWTAAGLLRHAAFKGLRPDRDLTDLVDGGN